MHKAATVIRKVCIISTPMDSLMLDYIVKPPLSRGLSLHSNGYKTVTYMLFEHSHIHYRIGLQMRFASTVPKDFVIKAS